MADQQITAGGSRIIESLDQSVLCILIEIYHNISAKNNIEF